MKKRRVLMVITVIVSLCACLCLQAPLNAKETAEDDFLAWLADFAQEARGAGISEKTLQEALAGARRLERVIELDRRQPEATRRLSEYLDMKITDSRLRRGRELLRIHSGLLNEVSAHYGVEPPVIVALWGMESIFGAYQGSYPVISSLATLAHDGRRGAYFRGELLQALKILDQGHITLENFSGSWAGALGQCQFMPSSFHAYARDFDGDGRSDIWGSLPDVFASIANYLARHGWKSGEPWGLEVLLPQNIDASLFGRDTRMSLQWWSNMGVRRSDGKEFPGDTRSAALVTPDGQENRHYLVFGNYDVFRRWNRSHYFAVAAGTLADSLGRAQHQH